jgi:hypothetical protein
MVRQSWGNRNERHDRCGNRGGDEATCSDVLVVYNIEHGQRSSALHAAASIIGHHVGLTQDGRGWWVLTLN